VNLQEVLINLPLSVTIVINLDTFNMNAL